MFLFPFTIVARSTTKYMALNAINLQCTFDQGKSPNGRDPCHPRAHICGAGGTGENLTPPTPHCALKYGFTRTFPQ